MSLLNSRSFYATAALLAVASLSTAALAQRAVLTSHIPTLVKQGKAERLGAVSASRQIQAVISLPLRNQDTLTALLADLYNPASPSYHRWLQPAEFDARFGPADGDYGTLVSWARSNGLDIVAKSKNGRVLTVQGSTGLINRAFHVQLTSYHDNLHNREFQAPDREPTMDISIPVFAISGLDTSNPRVNYHKKENVETLSPYVSVHNTMAATSVSDLVKPAQIDTIAAPVAPRITGSGPGNTYTPGDMRAAYYGSGPLTGSGQTVAIFSYDGYYASDVALWYSTTGITPSTIPVTNVLTGGFDGGCELNSPCDDGEQVLDILNVQGMAPGLSKIYFYEGLSAVAELNQMVSDNFAPVISCSWGGGDFGPGTTPYFLQMAAQGQTYLNATGDSGAFNGFTYAPPSLEANITQVGGTSLTTTGAGGPWSAEVAWADSGGGFFDPFIAIPSWQQTSGVITASNAGSTVMRNSPDIAAEANFDNTTASNGAFESGFGGTSFATPRLAGYIALANQQSATNGTGRLGFLNPTLYFLGLTSQATYYHDITSGTNRVASGATYNGVRTSFSAVTGYDLVTGWGSPNGPALLNALTGPNFALSTATSSIAVVRSSYSSFNVVITPINNFTGTPTFTVTNLPPGITASITPATNNQYTVKLTGDATVAPSSSAAVITATYGTFSHSVAVTVIGSKRSGYDFTISAPSATVQQMSRADIPVTVQLGSGTGSPVDLTVSNLPSGVTAQFGTPSTFSTSNLTFFASIATAPGTYTVLLTGTQAGALSHTVPVTLTILGVRSAIADGDFESATSPWTFTSTLNGGYLCNEACGYFQHGGSNFAYLNGWGATATDTLTQSFTVPSNSTVTLNFWLMIGTAETSTTLKNDNLTVTVTPTGGTSTTIATFSNLDKVSPGVYVLHSYDLSAFKGQTVTLKFQGVENSTRATAFFLDDISVVGQ